MAKRKRRLKLRYRILFNFILFISLFALALYAIYKVYVEDDLNSLIKTYNDTIYIEEDSSNANVRDESYNIAIIGTDEVEGTFHADSINLVSVNPTTKKMAITNVPRDAYVELECIDNYSDKITNAKHYGDTACVVNGLENLFEMEIEFYIETNFNGFVKIIDELGTVTTEVPNFLNDEPWCEEMSDRYTQICFSEFEEQTVDGQQALALARSRKYSSDLDRGNIQSQIINDTIDELIAIRDVQKLESILNVASDDFKTNIDHKQLTFIAYNYFMFMREDNVIEKHQVPGIADYGVGDYVGYGSYFFVDEVEFELLKNNLQELLKQE